MHGRIGESHGQQCLHFGAHGAGGVDHRAQGVRVGNAHAVDKARFQSAQCEALFYLRAKAMNDDQLHPQAVKQCHVVHQGGELRFEQRIAVKLNDEYAIPVAVYVGCGAAKAAHEGRLIVHGLSVNAKVPGCQVHGPAGLFHQFVDLGFGNDQGWRQNHGIAHGPHD